MKTKKIELTAKQLKLLMFILEESEEDRGNMGCNDPYGNEEAIFTKKERKEIQKSLYNNLEGEEIDGWLFNNQYVEYLIDLIKKQI